MAVTWTRDSDEERRFQSAEVWQGVDASGTRQWLIEQQITDEGSIHWQLYGVLHPDRDGVSGVEPLDVYMDLNSAQEAAETAGNQ